MLYRQDRTAASERLLNDLNVNVKTRGSGLCIFVNNSWCTISKEVSRFCSPEVEYLMISCRPHYLPREFSSVFFIAVYIPQQTNAGTKTALNELYYAISKQGNAHPEAALLVAGDFNAGKLKSVLTNLPDELNYFHARFEANNTETCMRAPAVRGDSAANVSKTFKQVNIHKARRITRTCTVSMR
jgi:hypothetical protein